MVELVNVLYQQHQAGRHLTHTIHGLVPVSQVPGEARSGLTARRKFGEEGLERYVERLAVLEQALGIHDLARLTPA